MNPERQEALGGRKARANMPQQPQERENWLIKKAT